MSKDGVEVDTSGDTGPVSEEDWIVHSVNIHGVFFERLCRRLIDETSRWEVVGTNIPVEFPFHTENAQGQESNLDILAEYRWVDRKDQCRNSLCLLIECKKNNPEFVKWMFFPKHTGINRPFSASTTNVIYLRQIFLETQRAPQFQFLVAPRIVRKRLPTHLILADEAREARGSYQGYKKNDKTRTANAAISDAAYQIALATQAVFSSDTNWFKVSLDRAVRANSAVSDLPWVRKVFLPVIVTSARLYTCDFDPRDIDVGKGEIPYSKTTISEEHFLIYEYPIPRHLQTQPVSPEATMDEGGIELFNRMHIAVVHSGYLQDFLNKLANGIEMLF